MILKKIINNRRKLLEIEKSQVSPEEIKRKARDILKSGYMPKPFLRAYKPGSPFLIAEIKKASPSKGIIRNDFNIEEIATAYKASEAVNAVSVLTEPDFFQGQYDYLKKAAEITGKPVLMKDFIIDEYQIYKGFINSASAFLLISAALKTSYIENFAELASELNMKVLFETHTASEYKQALNLKFDLIGINNRDLNTFVTDINTSINIIREYGKPENRVIIAESGINTIEDIRKLNESGINGFLIGEGFMREKDIGKAVTQLFGRFYE